VFHGAYKNDTVKRFNDIISALYTKAHHGALIYSQAKRTNY